LTEVVELEPILEDMDLKAQQSVINRNKVKRATKKQQTIEQVGRG
jgi:hypothetical protein